MLPLCGEIKITKYPLYFRLLAFFLTWISTTFVSPMWTPIRAWNWRMRSTVPWYRELELAYLIGTIGPDSLSPLRKQQSTWLQAHLLRRILCHVPVRDGRITWFLLFDSGIVRILVTDRVSRDSKVIGIVCLFVCLFISIPRARLGLKFKVVGQGEGQGSS